MSAIDIFNHAHVGNFFNIPIYWVFGHGPLSNLTDLEIDNEYEINQYFLSIGGGSGEHPALIIDNDAVLAQLFFEFEPIHGMDENDKIICEMVEKVKEKYYNNDDLIFWQLSKDQWPWETIINISNDVKRMSKRQLPLEQMLKRMFALFIIYEMPLDTCVVDLDLINIAKQIKANNFSYVFSKEYLDDYFHGFGGVLNCQKFGKIIKNNKVIWGYSLNDWMNDNVVKTEEK